MLNANTFTEGRATSTGPLDVAKAAGSDLTEFEAPSAEGGESAPQIEENERQRNRLGYTVTEETEEEMDGTTDRTKTATDPLDDGENTQKEMINRAPSGGGL